MNVIMFHRGGDAEQRQDAPDPVWAIWQTYSITDVLSRNPSAIDLAMATCAKRIKWATNYCKLIIFLVLLNTIVDVSDRNKSSKSAQLSHGLLLLYIVLGVLSAVAGIDWREHPKTMRVPAIQHLLEDPMVTLFLSFQLNFLMLVCWAVQAEDDRLLTLLLPAYIGIFISMTYVDRRTGPGGAALGTAPLYLTWYGMGWIKYLLVVDRAITLTYWDQSVSVDLRILYAVYAISDYNAIMTIRVVESYKAVADLGEACIPNKLLMTPWEELTFTDFVLMYTKPDHPIHVMVKNLNSTQAVTPDQKSPFELADEGATELSHVSGR